MSAGNLLEIIPADLLDILNETIHTDLSVPPFAYECRHWGRNQSPGLCTPPRCQLLPSATNTVSTLWWNLCITKITDIFVWFQRPAAHLSAPKAVQCRGHMLNKITSKLFQPLSTSVWNKFISARGNLPEIISKLFQRITAAHEYFPTCSMSLK